MATDRTVPWLQTCPQCGYARDDRQNFCSQCGQDLRLIGTLTLDRTGLIRTQDKIVSSILHIPGDDLTGKPFSIFVNVSDRAFFFSCWNKVLNSSKQQDLEVELKLPQDRCIQTRLILNPAVESGKAVDTVHMAIEDTTERRRTLQQLDGNEKLLEIIGSITEIFHPARRQSRQKTINGVLEKIAVVSSVQYAFISRMDPVSKLLFTEFKWQEKSDPTITKPHITLPLEIIHPVLEKLLQGATYIVEDISSLHPSEIEILKKWHPGVYSPGSMACELIYREHHPVGIIGLFRTSKGAWPRNTIMLMQLSAQLISETLPKSLSGYSIIKRLDAEEGTLISSEKNSNLDEIEAIIDETDAIEPSGRVEATMQIAPNPDGNPDNAYRVSATRDGTYALQCPKCRRTEFFSADLFETSGWNLKVTCPCSCSFRIIREMRQFYRKEVLLSGSFGRHSDKQNRLEALKWSSMEITNISKNGLNFRTPMALLLKVGDRIQLRFNLDNSSNALINKLAIIKSVRTNNIGCQFQNIDKYDTILGFYFL